MTTLRQAVEDYLPMRRHLGFPWREAGTALRDFVAFMEHHRASSITQTLALAWAQQPASAQPAPWAQRLSSVRGLARDRQASDPRTQIPAPGLFPGPPKRARPSLYSNQEIEAFLDAARHRPHRYQSGALLPWVSSGWCGLLRVTGLRLGEARNLALDDVDLTAAVLTVRGAKLGQTRLVPWHASTCQGLAAYIARRQRHWAGRPVSSSLLVSSWGKRLDSGQLHRAFDVRSRQSGLRGASDRHGPRRHDLRPRCATNTLGHWYRCDQDPARRLPLLSASLGHVHVADTPWYVEASPELMREAMCRLEQCWEDRP
jgi:integrase/recombinase XerD